MQRIAIIIVNYNGNKDTLECLHSIDVYLTHNENYAFDVLLVDNGSNHPITDEELEGFGITIHYIKSESNLGFAGGNNHAVKYIEKNGFSYDFIFLQNNDTLLVDDSVTRLLSTLIKSNTEIGGLVNYYFDNPQEVWQAGSYIREGHLSGKEVYNFNPKSESLVYVDAIPGSSMLIKYDVVKQLGLFDERYFAYYEEMDFCVRAKKNGYHVAFLPNTKILHKVGRSSTSNLKHYLRTRNTLLFYSLHYKNLMVIAYSRVFLRMMKEYFSSFFNADIISSTFLGIRDYKKGIMNKGSIPLLIK